jgi:hypothetical protein
MRTVFIIGEKIFGGLDGQLTNTLRHIVCVTNKLIRCHVSHRGYGALLTTNYRTGLTESSMQMCNLV